MLDKIILGTANFMQRYGVLFCQKMDAKEVMKILGTASKIGISTLDTALGYGDIFQNDLKEILKKSEINTKFSVLANVQDVYARLKAISCSYNIDVLMVHDAQHVHMTNHKEILELFNRLKEERVIRRVGVSVYDKQEVKNFYSRLCRPEVIQLPLNPLNQVFNDKCFIDYTRENSIEVHARSLFLQGILLTKELPIKFASIRGEIQRLIKELSNYPSRLGGLLTWANQIKWVKKWVIGVSSCVDLCDIVETVNDCAFPFQTFKFDGSSHYLVDPRNWN